MKGAELYPWLAKVHATICHYEHLKREGQIEDYEIKSVKVENDLAEVDVEVRGTNVPSVQDFIGRIRVLEKRV